MCSKMDRETHEGGAYQPVSILMVTSDREKEQFEEFMNTIKNITCCTDISQVVNDAKKIYDSREFCYVPALLTLYKKLPSVHKWPENENCAEVLSAAFFVCQLLFFHNFPASSAFTVDEMFATVAARLKDLIEYSCDCQDCDLLAESLANYKFSLVPIKIRPHTDTCVSLKTLQRLRTAMLANPETLSIWTLDDLVEDPVVFKGYESGIRREFAEHVTCLNMCWTVKIILDCLSQPASVLRDCIQRGAKNSGLKLATSSTWTWPAARIVEKEVTEHTMSVCVQDMTRSHDQEFYTEAFREDLHIGLKRLVAMVLGQNHSWLDGFLTDTIVTGKA
uniref:Virion protein n=1 Tax=Wood mouse herpesvirus TaxID=432370 RepID=D0PPD6_9GAMA|nr:virion protein [Wood mouse herpesvirus]